MLYCFCCGCSAFSLELLEPELLPESEPLESSESLLSLMNGAVAAAFAASATFRPALALNLATFSPRALTLAVSFVL